MNRSKTKFLVAFVTLVALANVAFSSAAAQNPPSRLAMRVLRDIQYFTGPAADPKFHSLDLYLPDEKSNVPMMLFVPGGGWRAGDKSLDGQGNFVDLFIRQGMAVASINYRLSPAVKHPALPRPKLRVHQMLLHME